MIVGILFRLALCALFFYVAHYALQPDTFRKMLEDLAERFFKPKDAFDKANDYRHRIVQVLYVFSAIFFLSGCLFAYKNLRHLKVVEDAQNAATPYAVPRSTPGYPGMAPGQPQPTAPAAAGQPYGGQPAGSAQPSGGQPAGAGQPYGGQPAGTGQPYGGQPAGRAQPSGERPPGTGQPYGGAQPYGR